MLRICGVDEVGRGPLAGPVVACALVLPVDFFHPEVTDSKKLSEKKRLKLYDYIKQKAVCYAVGRAEVHEIDKLNIFHASLLAMQRAIEQIEQHTDYVYIDGKYCPKINPPCEAIVKGDEKMPCISAASIVAKVTRDLEMIELDAQYPDYGFKQHMGYPTKAHLAALKLHGPCPIHRQSFAPVKSALQQTL